MLGRSKTLLDLFRPPEALYGQTGLLSALSGTADFLEEAAAAFSLTAPRRREHLGHSVFFLMLDGHKTTERPACLRPAQIPGVLELAPLPEKHGELMHAKVGLLRFGPSRAGRTTLLRLIVSTGNWTQASARRQLELAWSLDVTTGDEGPVGPAADRADLAEAAAFFSSLLERYVVADAVRTKLDETLTLARLGAPKVGARRFIHTLQAGRIDAGTPWRGTSILEHLKNKAPHDREQLRDTLLCGAGFYESAGGRKRDAMPEVLQALDGLPGLKPGRRVAVARPDDAGALASWDRSESPWVVLPAVDRPAEARAQGARRALHAKFIYVGRKRGSSVRDGWLYLGSGNLTRRGLLWPPRAVDASAAVEARGSGQRGNVEAGVILAVPDTLDADALARHLYTDLDAEEFESAELKSGHDDDDDLLSNPVFAPPAVLLAREVVNTDGSRSLELSWSGAHTDTTTPFEVRFAGTSVVIDVGQRLVALPTGQPCPPVITLHHDGQDVMVPVMDVEGRICRVPLPPARFDDLLSDLLNFPLPPPDEDDTLDGDGDGGNEAPVDEGPEGFATTKRKNEEEIRYALKDAMDLLERVAALQTTMPAGWLPDWFVHLETRLRESFSETQKSAWRSLGVPFFQTLAKPGFRPRHMGPEEHKQYDALLRRVAKAWNMTGSP